MVRPCVPVLELATLVTVRSAIDNTPRTAVAVRELVPTEVVKEPDGMVLVNVPDTELVFCNDIIVDDFVEDERIH